MLKYVLAFFAFVIFSVPIVNAQKLVEENAQELVEEDENGQLLEDKSWYEIDGIQIRYGFLRNNTDIFYHQQEQILPQVQVKVLLEQLKSLVI